MLAVNVPEEARVVDHQSMSEATSRYSSISAPGIAVAVAKVSPAASNRASVVTDAGVDAGEDVAEPMLRTETEYVDDAVKPVSAQVAVPTAEVHVAPPGVAVT